MTINVPSGSYVYFHLKKESGEVFYIGKGTGYRAWSKEKRNNHWQRVVDKYGLKIEIVEEGLSHEEALKKELNYIKFFRMFGVNLTNITTGGIGGVSKPVFCSNGMIFESINEAALYVCKNSIEYHSVRTNIGQCANGSLNSARGHAWSFDGVPEKPLPKSYLNRLAYGTTVYRSDGKKYNSIACVIDDLRKDGHKCSTSGLFSSIGEGRFYCGYVWKKEPFGSDDTPPVVKKIKWRDLIGRRVISSEGICFFSVADAADYLMGEKDSIKSRANIHKAASGKINSACGMSWSFDCSAIPLFKKPAQVMSESKKKPVKNSDGEIFDSLQYAAEIMKKRGETGGSRSNISRSIRSKGKKMAANKYWYYL